MQVHFTPDLQHRIDEFVLETGRAPEQLLADAIAGYFGELTETREMLNSRYDDLKNGSVKAIDREEFFESLRKREDELLKEQ
jgi:hypothetical protein